MREAIGATWIMGIVLVFIVMFSGYLAFSVNYAKAFKVKDGIVDRIEKHNGFNQETVDDIADFMSGISYNSRGKCSREVNEHDPLLVGVTRNVPEEGGLDELYNYCIRKVSANNPSGQLTAAYYKVVVFFSLSLPILDQISNFSVTGETTNLYYPIDDWF